MQSGQRSEFEFLDPWSKDPDHHGPIPADARLIGAWNLYVGIDHIGEALFLVRGEQQDLLWAFTSFAHWEECLARRDASDPEWASDTITCGCVAGLPRRGTDSEAAARLLRALVASRVGHAIPQAPWRAGLLSEVELERVVDGVVEERARNRKTSEDRQRNDEAPILRLARQLGLSPAPDGASEHNWLASCPGRGHSLMLSPTTNQFGCGYCRRRGGLDELQALYDSRHAAPSTTTGVAEREVRSTFSDGPVTKRSKAGPCTAVLTNLRQGEAPLDGLSAEDRNWLETAMTHLAEIDQGRRAESVLGSAFCVFETDRGYFQCLAHWSGTSLLCESVSEKNYPAIAAIITPEKADRLVREFGFRAPGDSGNFAQRIDVRGNDDLAYVARLAFRVLRDVYGVKDFSAARFKLSLPKPATPVSAEVALPGLFPAASEKPYVVFVDDNFHFMDEDERYKHGEYATLEEAEAQCRMIVDDFLESQYKPGMSAAALFEQYMAFGEDPFIRGPGTRFSASDYARTRCDELCSCQGDRK
ncbi:hypothetical protein JQ543_29335 [Bradyrhizobium diazoefficiens]|nr:hypothetical protein [Bradyrhizobium diazoefficiens]MBR0851874.1 hypothetical protein [Bradyrhizobium diazoefficiens]